MEYNRQDGDSRGPSGDRSGGRQERVGRWQHSYSAPSAGSSARPSRPPARTGGYGAGRPAGPSRGGSYGAPRSGGYAPRGGGYGGSRDGGSRFGGGGRGGGRGYSRGGRQGSFGETEAELSRFINKAVITEESAGPFMPEHKFDDFLIGEHLKKNIAAKGYVSPTPIQDKAIPHALRGEDVVGLAETGTGKTAAFLIPLIEKVMSKKGERVLIMAPTRELAVQIEMELRGFAKGMGFRGMVAVGGASIGPQMSALRQQPAFVIGTPGRLKDLMERRALDLSDFGTVVLDEADRMLDMGFIEDMRFILSKMRQERHTLFFSATMGKEIQRLIGDFLVNPVTISVKTRDTSKNVDQDVVRIPRGADKFDVLVEMLAKQEFSRVLIFGRTKHGVERLAKMLSAAGIRSESIHGNKTHGARQKALGAFKEGRVKALVATDVAARGLDIPMVTHVINYDLPSTYEDYVHRIGRTGRGDNKGLALTFVEDRGPRRY